ncbi:UTRA domain-containing protein [Fertoebacter nigrum]|uniref:UTRA domain-containing protein n=1 Tax=Fertoeibacter niger TaxID=2656921 RepID=A0A8X8GUU9_9RHOB|nr:GntR family transcriptional regulator [Fertoeibacter niger]NUB43542.1 UTRA domain-containing protein [Fertoeibacter niger]
MPDWPAPVVAASSPAKPLPRPAPQGWEAIRAEVLHRIHARLWLPGATIPTEEALAQEFGCARATVNRALRDLAEAGVLERRRKAGTRVALHPVRRATLDIPVTRREVEGRGQSYGLHLLEQALLPAPVPVAAQLGLAPATPLLHLCTLHLADGRPFLYEVRWLNPALLPDPAPDFAAISANEWLVGHVPYTTGDIAFSAANATAHEAEVLGLAPGTALFITERCTWSGDRAITAVRLAYAPGYRLHTMV